ncbi:MAG: ribonuclease J [Candidatus Obscuribacterales bacterium]|nr:ribonuclease J [Candidatus Obscuribacterales bacterium]
MEEHTLAHIVTGGVELRNDRLTVIPLGGQSEIGQALWIIAYGGEMLLIDAGASYPSADLPGVDLLLPNTNFLEANQEKILGLLLTNAHEEHCGAVSYLLHHLKIPKIMGPRFVSAFLAQCAIGGNSAVDFECPQVDVIETRRAYQIGPFEVEWFQVNDAVADACALKIGTPEGVVIYTSSFKLDQTPVDNKLMDVAALAKAGDDGVLLLIGDSAGVEHPGYTASEKAVVERLRFHIATAHGRAFVVMPGTNTHRLQILFDIARGCNRRVLLVGDTLVRTAVSAAITGNLTYDRKLEASLADLKHLADDEILIIATGREGDPIQILDELAFGQNKEITMKEGDIVIYSAEVSPGRARQMANILDQFLVLGVATVFGARKNVHVSKHASREELKLMFSLTHPHYFVPALGEGRHIMNHANLAIEWGIPSESIFPLKNGEILEIGHGNARIIGATEAQPVLFNRDQGERVTTYSVNERRTLSLEGIVSVGLVVTEKGDLVSGPSIEVDASGFLRSAEWEVAKIEVRNNILETVNRYSQHSSAKSDDRIPYELSALRSSVREIVVKTLRAKLQAKPTVQVIVHELSTSRPQ